MPLSYIVYRGWTAVKESAIFWLHQSIEALAFAMCAAGDTSTAGLNFVGDSTPLTLHICSDSMHFVHSSMRTMQTFSSKQRQQPVDASQPCQLPYSLDQAPVTLYDSPEEMPVNQHGLPPQHSHSGQPNSRTIVLPGASHQRRLCPRNCAAVLLWHEHI
jgi:hypothetical protein